MEERLVLAKFRTLIQTAEIDLSDVALSDELLSCFLQARKNSLDRAFDLFRNYHKMAVNNPNLMAPSPFMNLQKIFGINHVAVSPIRDEKSGCRVIFFKNFHDIDHLSLTAEEHFRNIVTVWQYLMSHADTRQILVIVDAKDASFRLLKKFGPSFARKCSALFNNALPIRFYRIHMLNEHLIAKLMFKILWPFLSDKIQKRFHFHGNSLEPLHRQVSLCCLPNEYGGSLGPIDRMNLSNIIAENGIENIFECLNKQLF